MVWLLLPSEVLYSPLEQNDLLLWPLGSFLPLLPGLQAVKTPHVVHQLEDRHNTKKINTRNLFIWAYILYTQGFAWVWFLRNGALGLNTIPSVLGGIEAWTLHTQSDLRPPSQSKRTNTVASWNQNPMESLTLRPANPTVCVASQELRSQWHMHHKNSLKYCPLGSHQPQAAQESSTSKTVLLSYQQNHLWLVTCKVNKIPFLFLFLEIFSVFFKACPLFFQSSVLQMLRRPMYGFAFRLAIPANGFKSGKFWNHWNNLCQIQVKSEKSRWHQREPSQNSQAGPSICFQLLQHQLTIKVYGRASPAATSCFQHQPVNKLCLAHTPISC